MALVGPGDPVLGPKKGKDGRCRVKKKSGMDRCRSQNHLVL